MRNILHIVLLQTIIYLDVYKKCGFKVFEKNEYRNFLTIYMDKEEALV